MCEGKERAADRKDRVDGGAAGGFGPCAPMMQGMFGKFRAIMREASDDSSAQAAGAAESAGSTGAATSGLDARERELVALGAAMGSNCVPCIEYHVPKAREAGLTDAQIRDAVRLADRVRKVPARKVLDTAHQLLSDDAADAVSSPDTPSPGRGATPTAADDACCG